MEFLAFVAVDGPLWKAWTAAHWERSLKRADYQTANIKAAAGFATEHMAVLTLSFEGSILLGLCRLLLGRWRLIEEDAYELRTALRMSVEYGGKLPSVSTVAESSLTLNAAHYREAHLWEQLDVELLPAWEGLDLAGPPLELLAEPDVDMGIQMIGEVPGISFEAPRHVADLASITLPSPSGAAAGAFSSEGRGPGSEDFGAPSAAERAAMEALSPQQELPPVDFLLGAGSASVEALMPPSSWGSMRPGWLPGAEELPTVGPPSSFGPSIGRESMAPVTPPQRDVARILDFDTPVAEALGAAAAADSATRRQQADYLARIFDETPRGEGRTADELALVEAAKPPPQKRQRRLQKTWDRSTEIPNEAYLDTTEITRRPMHDYHLLLPYMNPQISYTTVFSDVHPALGEFFLLARQMGDRRRAARQAALAADRAAASAAADAPPAAPTPPAAEAAGTPGLRPPSMAGASPVPSMPPAVSPAVSLRPPSPGAAAPTPPGDFGAELPTPGPEPMDVDMQGDGVSGHAPSPMVGEGAIVLREPAEVKERPEAFDDCCRRLGEAQDARLRSTFEHSPDAAVSFLGLCREPPADAESATCRFLALLSSHMAGQISVDQAAPYQDILITRGPSWDAAAR
eukprot:TRINITY_DN12596_c0_g3_i1.p1 TRINITY_DN12596_c0_g3~~TRINITY_DN12596_c0_g3_i1.p1  ORF type:complete len:663 (-),score=136.91 TRINITY_DN12596_c0_g3_i1:77-1969(-)